MDHQGVHHEESDVNVRTIFLFGGLLVVVAAVVHLVVWGLFLFFDQREAGRLPREFPLAAGQELRLPPEPRLQITPRVDLQEFRAREDEVLNGYSWIDRAAGTVRMPMADAMRLTVQKGLPSRPAAEAGEAR
jgi:hypothetical protein